MTPNAVAALVAEMLTGYVSPDVALERARNIAQALSGTVIT
jgi:hypothetical protein